VYPGPEEFAADLDAFLTGLPAGWKYAVEIRNEEFLHPLYFTTLRRHGVAHVWEVVSRARKKRESAYLFINNRLEGNAPVTIDAIVHDGVSQDDD
jgi:hypothetical protein